MKTYNRTELTEMSAKVFAQFETTHTLYATSDGQFFIQEDRAKLHARGNAKMSIYEIERPEQKKVVPLNEDQDSDKDTVTDPKDDLTPKSELLKGNAKTAIKAIKEVKDKDALIDLLNDEKASKNRSIVVEAIEEILKAFDAPKE